jgi:hypothetical protein
MRRMQLHVETRMAAARKREGKIRLTVKRVMRAKLTVRATTMMMVLMTMTGRRRIRHV